MSIPGTLTKTFLDHHIYEMVCVCVCVCVCAGLGMVLGIGYEYHCPVVRHCREMKTSKMAKTLDLGVRGSWFQILGSGNLGQVMSPLQALVSIFKK